MRQTTLFAATIAAINLIGGITAIILASQTSNLAMFAWGVMQASVAGLVWFLSDEHNEELVKAHDEGYKRGVECALDEEATKNAEMRKLQEKWEKERYDEYRADVEELPF